MQFGQALDYPTVDVALNRERAGLLGVKMADVAALAGGGDVLQPVHVADLLGRPEQRRGLPVQVQVPQSAHEFVEECRNIPVSYQRRQPILLRNIATVTNGTTVGQYERYNMQRMVTLTANIAGADLGTVARQVAQAHQRAGRPPPKVNVAVRGQIVPMQQMLDGLQTGLLLAVVVIFLLLAANFQSVKLSAVVVSTVPAVIAGVVAALWLTRTTLNIQSFMGAIMAIGVAVANAILLVTFAERARHKRRGRPIRRPCGGAPEPACAPILMTSPAMIAGMCRWPSVSAKAASKPRRSAAPSSADWRPPRWRRCLCCPRLRPGALPRFQADRLAPPR